MKLRTFDLQWFANTLAPLPVKTLSAGDVAAKIVDSAGVNQLAVNSSGAIPISSLPALATGSNVIGAVTQSGTWNVTVNSALPSGSNNIGIVTTSLPYTLLSSGQTALVNSGVGVLGVYNSSAPTLTSAQAAPLQLDAAGNLLVNVKVGGGGSSTFPYAGTQGQALTSNSFLGVGGVYYSAAPTLTNSQFNPFSLDVSGNLNVNLKTAIPTGSNVIGAVTQSGTWNVALSTGSNVIGAVTQSGTWTVTVGTALPTGSNVIGAVTQSGTWNVTVSTALPTGSNTIGAVTQSGTWNVTVNASLPAGSAIIGKVGIDQTTPGTTNGVQVTGPGTTAANPLYVSAAGGPGSVKNSGNLTTASLAAGGSTTLSASAITSTKTGSLLQVICSGTIPISIQIQSVNTSGVATTVLTLIGTASDPTVIWQPFDFRQIQIASADGTNAKFQVIITNLDPVVAANVYAFISWQEQ